MIYRKWTISRAPLPAATFYILFALATGEKHGYGIMKEARDLSENRISIGPATLYTTVQRLLDSRWIQEVPGPADHDPRRRYYRITRSGQSALHDEMQRMEAIVRKSKALRLKLTEVR